MIRRLASALALIALCAMPAAAHVGSPDVFYEGDAGPYHLFVTVRCPDAIPGIATIEIRASDTDIESISVVPLRLTGPGSKLPPTPDRAARSSVDPKFFSAELWLMERGSLQVRVSANGRRGAGVLAVPVPAAAQRTLSMDRGLGSLLFALMAVLALALISILASAVREAMLEPGADPGTRERRRTRIAAAVAGIAVTGGLAFGSAWWDDEAESYAQLVAQPWSIAPRIAGCELTLSSISAGLLPDHGHELHLFVVRVPALDRLAHLHPTRAGENLVQALPSLPAGRYAVFADIVLESGYPITGTGEIDLPELACSPLSGDDAQWAGAPAAARPTAVAPLEGGGQMRLELPGPLRAAAPVVLRFHVQEADGSASRLEPYMGMAGHAIVMKTDRSVFAHLHPSGSVAMPALDLARQGIGERTDASSHAAHHAELPSDVSFPYGFPTAGWYRTFVQVKRAGRIETASFDLRVD